MLGKIFGTVGGFLGKEFFGGGILSTIGRFAGQKLGDYFDRKNKNYETNEFYNFKNVHDSFALSIAYYGEPIPLIFGTIRVNGKIIWSSDIKKIAIQTTDKSYFTNGGDTQNIYHNTEFEYYLSFAIGICEGEISDIARVWVNNELINIGDYRFRLYKGSKDQNIDPLIAAYSDGKAPAYRDLAYIVFEDINLSNFGNKVPIFSFEVTRKCNVRINVCVEDIVKSMIMIPGSGEYVYDTIVQYKTLKSLNNTPIAKQKINSHNYHNIANAIHSLNQLKLTCENIEWVAPVVCWFGDDLSAAKCSIMPAVEFNDKNISYSEDWKIANYNRESARLISRDQNGNPKYGGSVNDASVLRYLGELKNRGLKIMFYPMFFLDIEDKPWRGHLTGSPESIRNFFTKPTGYNNFILHYAKLVKNHVDAFVIGSELIGLTKIAANPGVYPAVQELIELAKTVKTIVGNNVVVTYAADWSEYHHTEGGWYNLDPLWASPHIDFIGIDAYFPVTRATSSNILVEEIISGWQKGNGYDYYLDDQNIAQSLEPKYAWKNIKYWWENYHQNPDGNKTSWVPKSKKIWFTEFGFPSIDKATNQPNVFFDPLCSDGGEPIYSTGEIDFSIQRRSIRAFLEYWQTQEYMERMFLWTWDARPYPAWPHMNFWRDGYLWEKGHWVNNKFGAASLAAIILELSHRCNIDINKIDVNSLDETIEGFIIDNGLSAWEAINLLRISYFFDIKTKQQEQIIFTKRGQNTPYPFLAMEPIKISDNSYLEEIEIDPASVISRVDIYFIDHSNEYNNAYVNINNEHFSNKSIATVKLPIVLSFPESERLGRIILNNAAIENKVLKFIIPITSLQYEPGDLVVFTHLNYNYQIRIISIFASGLTLKITGVVDKFESYYMPQTQNKLEITESAQNDAEFYILDLPINFAQNKPHLMVYLTGTKPYDLYATIVRDEAKYHKVKTLDAGAITGSLVSFQQNTSPNIFLIDRLSKFTIFCKNFAVSEKWNLCLIGDEIIRFKDFQKIGDNLYEIFQLIRGIAATEEFINSHQTGEDFIILGNSVNIIEVSSKLENQSAIFKLNNNSKTQNLYFQNKSQKLPKPYLKLCKIEDNILILKLLARANIDEWQEANGSYTQQFIININNSDTIKAEKPDIDINLAELGLSAPLFVDIIVKEQGRESLPLKLNI